jgi:hypothetical protein
MRPVGPLFWARERLESLAFERGNPEGEEAPMKPENQLLEERLERAYEDMLMVLEGAIAKLLETNKRAEEGEWGGEVPEVVAPVFKRALKKKADRVFRRAAFIPGLKLERVAGVILVDGRRLRADRETAHSLAHRADFSPDVVLEMARALERTASELLQALEDARRVALRVGRRCLESPAMREIARRAALRRMQKA